MEKHFFGQSQSPYVYEMLKELVPKKSDDDFIEFLFNINGVPGEKSPEENITMVLNKRFNLDLTVNENGFKDIIKFTRTKDILSIEIVIQRI